MPETRNLEAQYQLFWNLSGVTGVHWEPLVREIDPQKRTVK